MLRFGLLIIGVSTAYALGVVWLSGNWAHFAWIPLSEGGFMLVAWTVIALLLQGCQIGPTGPIGPRGTPLRLKSWPGSRLKKGK
jgi:hypothetical protein